MSTYWVPMVCLDCGHEDQADSEDLNDGLVLLCEQCGSPMEPM